MPSSSRLRTSPVDKGRANVGIGPYEIGLSKIHVIASQCSHWRGNPPDIQTS